MAEKRLLTVSRQDPRDLLALLVARLGVDAEAARDWLSSGAVYLAGQRCRAGDTALAPGMRVTVHMPAGPRAPDAAAGGPMALDAEANQDGPQAGEARTSRRDPLIVDADEDLLIVEKPAGLLSQPGPAGGRSLLQWLEDKGERPYLIHRLDREASGLLVLARRKEACPDLQEALSSGELKRRYLAVVAGRPAVDEDLIELRIGTHRDRRLRSALPKAAPGGQPAATRYRVEQTLPSGRTLLSLELLSGRTHQIRVHLQAIGHPIVGDLLYGGAPERRLLLHAVELHVPQRRETRRYQAPAEALFSQ